MSYHSHTKTKCKPSHFYIHFITLTCSNKSIIVLSETVPVADGIITPVAAVDTQDYRSCSIHCFTMPVPTYQIYIKYL